VNGNIQQLNLAEFKPDPCPCGYNEWTIDRYGVAMVHRFRADIKAMVIKERQTCRSCLKSKEVNQA
jgi:hypothetical protein